MRIVCLVITWIIQNPQWIAFGVVELNIPITLLIPLIAVMFSSPRNVVSATGVGFLMIAGIVLIVSDVLVFEINNIVCGMNS